jgi:hypothetical protein
LDATVEYSSPQPMQYPGLGMLGIAKELSLPVSPHWGQNLVNPDSCPHRSQYIRRFSVMVYIVAWRAGKEAP